MQYDLRKELSEKVSVKLCWHGEPTKVLLKGQAEKTPVKKGDVIKVTATQARELLSYSHLWVFEGDEPTAQPFESRSFKGGAEKVAAPEAPEKEPAPEVTGKAKIIEELKALGATFNDQASEEELGQLLADLKQA